MQHTAPGAATSSCCLVRRTYVATHSCGERADTSRRCALHPHLYVRATTYDPHKAPAPAPTQAPTQALTQALTQPPVPAPTQAAAHQIGWLERHILYYPSRLQAAHSAGHALPGILTAPGGVHAAALQCKQPQQRRSTTRVILNAQQPQQCRSTWRARLGAQQPQHLLLQLRSALTWLQGPGHMGACRRVGSWV
jgi:hypothetical protein